MRKRSGVLVPLFSVYSRKSSGIGDLNDMKLLIDWCARTGNTILQLLPMNETVSTNCPYDAISSFALDSVYFHLGKNKLAIKKTGMYVDYKIRQAKIRILRKDFIKDGGRSSAGLRVFSRANSYWLNDFALYKALKDLHRGKPWYEWEEQYKNRDTGSMEDFRKLHLDEINFQIWLQWRLCGQFKTVKAYAGSKGVLIKGDLPVLVSRDSADVWAHQEFFKLGFAAGAPPDMYCARGQRWGMPTYNWDAIARDGYRYLKEKLRYAENFYDMLRIDHAVGLFRIWSIPYSDPPENQGLNGRFDPQDENLWEGRGRVILSKIIENTKMLICAEDLGIIPASCPKVLKELGIPGNDVQRWTKDWAARHDFLGPEEYRGLSVAMLSTHDTTNWPAWWKYEAGTVDEGLFRRRCAEKGLDFECIKAKLFDPKLSKHGRLRWREKLEPKDLPDGFLDLYENTFKEKEKLWAKLNMPPPMREEANKELVKKALETTFASNSIFTINTLIDLLFLTGLLRGDPYKYRINTPGTISEKNWSLRLPEPLEELLKKKYYNEIKWISSRSP